MEEQANKIQYILNTLQGVTIEATHENLDRMLGSRQALMEVRDWLRGEANNGNVDA
jgi:hypothetical protein